MNQPKYSGGSDTQYATALEVEKVESPLETATKRIYSMAEKLAMLQDMSAKTADGLFGPCPEQDQGIRGEQPGGKIHALQGALDHLEGIAQHLEDSIRRICDNI